MSASPSVRPSVRLSASRSALVYTPCFETFLLMILSCTESTTPNLLTPAPCNACPPGSKTLQSLPPPSALPRKGAPPQSPKDGAGDEHPRPVRPTTALGADDATCIIGRKAGKLLQFHGGVWGACAAEGRAV